MIEAILTDIEGTTSSIAFVHDTLFPFATKHMAEFVATHHARADVAPLLANARDQAGLGADEDVAACLLNWIREDKKVTALKAIQGLIWEEGYQSGELKGHVYADAARGLQRWHEQGLHLGIYSSGSVYAQKLIFGFSEAGDLTPLFRDYFDTQVGHKREVASYAAIAQAMGRNARHILFLSDVAEELDAAHEANFQTIQLVRDSKVIPSPTHRKVSSFDEIEI